MHCSCQHRSANHHLQACVAGNARAHRAVLTLAPATRTWLAGAEEPVRAQLLREPEHEPDQRDALRGGRVPRLRVRAVAAPHPDLTWPSSWGVYLLIALYLDNVLPNESDVRRQ